MKTVFTPGEIRKNKGCYNMSQVDKLSFISQQEITIEDILNSEIPLKDKAWFMRNRCEMTTLEKQWFTIGCAEVVLSIYEDKNPNNKAPREAIQAAKDYLNDNCTIEFLKEKRAAAYAAADAAAAAADADAAYAAYAAADADAAADAYAAAAAAYGKISYKESLLIFMKEFAKLSVENKKVEA